MRWATCCCPRWQSASRPACAARTPWRAWGETSSWSCCTSCRCTAKRRLPMRAAWAKRSCARSTCRTRWPGSATTARPASGPRSWAGRCSPRSICSNRPTSPCTRSSRRAAMRCVFSIRRCRLPSACARSWRGICRPRWPRGSSRCTTSPSSIWTGASWALRRWIHPERGLIAPSAFIGVAEESELIVPMGHWVLRTACEQLAAWENDARYRHGPRSVNVSARQFRQRDFVARVVEVLRETGARPHLLKLELTESLVLDNVDDTIAKMGLLKTKGVRFSVDDFGTGYSSLAYLTRLPLDQLKIDQSFVRNLGLRHTDDVIVQTIIGMARNLELDVIAEGVETAQQKALLADYGCQLFQGYLLGMPGPVSELEVLLQQAATQASAEGAAG